MLLKSLSLCVCMCGCNMIISACLHSENNRKGKDFIIDPRSVRCDPTTQFLPTISKHHSHAKSCIDCESSNVSMITPLKTYYKQIKFHTNLLSLYIACTHLQTDNIDCSHIHTPSAQQVECFASNVIFQPISSIIALLIFQPPSMCQTGLGMEKDAGFFFSPTGNQPVHINPRKRRAQCDLCASI